MTVVRLDDYRTSELSGPVELSLYWPPVMDERGVPQRHTVTLRLDAGDVEEMLDQFGQNGFVALTDPNDRAVTWRMPWASAVIKIRSLS